MLAVTEHACLFVEHYHPHQIFSLVTLSSTLGISTRRRCGTWLHVGRRTTWSSCWLLKRNERVRRWGLLSLCSEKIQTRDLTRRAPCQLTSLRSTTYRCRERFSQQSSHLQKDFSSFVPWQVLDRTFVININLNKRLDKASTTISYFFKKERNWFFRFCGFSHLKVFILNSVLL